jgi:hypothetical protein
VHPLLAHELVAARIDDLHRQARGERLASSLRRPTPSRVERATRRALRSFGYLLVGAGLRLAVAGDPQGRAGRRAA